MIRKRFPAERRRRIIGWTTLAVAWVTALVARGAATPVAPSEQVSPEPVVVQPQVIATPAPLPTLPAEGLVVLHYTPVPKPEAEVRRVVVTRTVAAPASSAQPTTVSSSGS